MVDHVDDEPTPDQFDFTDLYGRTHGLVAFYHQGAPYLLQVTQLIWQQPLRLAKSHLVNCVCSQGGQVKANLACTTCLKTI